METLVKLNSQTAGRDKLARLLQYLSRIIWHSLKTRNKTGVDSIKNIEFQLSTFRKLLRFGRFADTLYTAIHQNHKATAKHSVSIISKVYSSFFLFADHMLWLGRADVCKVDTDKWSRRSNQYWLYSIAFNLIVDFMQICTVLSNNRSRILPKQGLKGASDVGQICSKSVKCLQENRGLVVDTVKNGCDFFIPLNALGHVKLSPGTVGWLGVVSSLAGLIVLIDPRAKLN
ncbi:PREDICTED: peroxisomal membrane protein 11B [Nicrophorus vespilloides]|uniref:Peroxisomal membrane protein 11B n=1 Tax=Nicrophorus vespilloides TaxID=110193 RepID=A0ABM1MG13_NICVS|nr:PREDICTED: peroxisomal membrane protein 11B [Nicrophorus vespilloides]